MSSDIMRLLLVEDSENDASLLLAELKRKGHNPFYVRVDTKANYLTALKTRSWDAVISDYVLPQFSGPEALRLLRHQGSDIPFLMVSGIYGEEEAVNMMKSGANDYILKGNLSRLAPALERELDAARDRRRHERVSRAMYYLAAIVESSEEAIYGKNLEGQIMSWNPAAERLFGYSAEEIIGHPDERLMLMNRCEELLNIGVSIQRGEAIGIQDTQRLKKSGQIISVSVTVSPIRNASGEIIGSSSISRDISKQKAAEFERQQLIAKLSAAAHQVKTLSGLLPICATCKRIRDDKGYWQQVETYITKYSEAVFTHGICPQCAEEYERQFELK